MREKFNLPEDMYFQKDGEPISIMDIEPDPKILNLAREFDEKQAKKKKIQRKRHFVQVAAMIMVCFVTFSAITLESSDAFRLKIYQIFSIQDEGSAALLSQDEYDLIGDWKDYWYPTYIPEGFVLQAAEKTEFEKVMLFSSDAREECRIREIPMDAAITVDTEHTSIEEVKIGYHNGFLMVTEEYDSLSIYWSTEDRQLCIEMTGKHDKDTLLKIAEKMEYRER
ncbi:DUF4367 domain-containing protein [Senimuribacter intestinalis]|jgi:hypothetical protein|uniref:DUF4367 domain-containing protein n=1 Tax=Senimuribacter intestinalis TaxID=2941507 RepID=UPI002041F8D0|nr:DUF4367 domain-containing protein [Senimuribacter intestinalis]